MGTWPVAGGPPASASRLLSLGQGLSDRFREELSGKNGNGRDNAAPTK
jgi:hypothetical protein